MNLIRSKREETPTKYRVVAIDGPAGAGKSTIARLVAKKLGFLYIDTGAMYRALTLKVLIKKIDPQDEPSIIKLAQTSSIELRNKNDGSLEVFLDGGDITQKIRDSSITRVVSDISKI